MSGVFWSILVWIVVCSFSGTGVFLAASLVARRMDNASLRHSVWLLAFALVPIFSVYYALQPGMISTACAAGAPPAVAARLSPSAASLLAQGALGVWLVMMLFILARAFVGWTVVKHWRSGKFPARCTNEDFSALDIRVALDDWPVVPLSTGIVKPMILLPRDAVNWDWSRLTAVLYHELAHIRRRDTLTQLLAMLLCAVHWFNPLFWRAARRLEAEAEIAADDFALIRGVKPSSYANELLAIARRLSGAARVCAVGHTAMARSSALEERLMAILDPKTRRGGLGLLTFARTAAVLLSLSVAVAFAAPRATSLFLQSTRENPTCTPTNP